MAACGRCHGAGEIVEPVLVWDNQKGDFVILQRAVPCSDCGGKGTT